MAEGSYFRRASKSSGYARAALGLAEGFMSGKKSAEEMGLKRQEASRKAALQRMLYGPETVEVDGKTVPGAGAASARNYSLSGGELSLGKGPGGTPAFGVTGFGPNAATLNAQSAERRSKMMSNAQRYGHDARALASKEMSVAQKMNLLQQRINERADDYIKSYAYDDPKAAAEAAKRDVMKDMSELLMTPETREIIGLRNYGATPSPTQGQQPRGGNGFPVQVSNGSETRTVYTQEDLAEAVNEGYIPLNQ